MPTMGGNPRRNMEIRRYPVLVYALVPLAALVLQAWLPRALRGYAWFDLPLVVTVYFALGRRSPIQGTLMVQPWASLKMRSPSTPSASTASPRPSSASWQPRSASASTLKTTPSASLSLSALPALQRHLRLRLPHAAGPQPQMELDRRNHQSRRQLPHRHGRLSLPRPSPNQRVEIAYRLLRRNETPCAPSIERPGWAPSGTATRGPQRAAFALWGEGQVLAAGVVVDGWRPQKQPIGHRTFPSVSFWPQLHPSIIRLTIEIGLFPM